MNIKLQRLSKGSTGKLLMEVLEEVKRKVADIRTPLNAKSVKKEFENEIRLGIIECIDIFLVDELKVMNGDLEKPNPDEHV